MSSQKYCYDYPRPAVTNDCVVFNSDSGDHEILLIRRKGDPYKDYWALPGGFMQMDETADESAKRELKEETGIQVSDIEQLHTFSSVDRDPRGRTISISFIAFVKASDNRITAGDDAGEARWFRLDDLPPLAFDHEQIVRMAVLKLKERS
jgi:8-oxo-dGTP diphosphatase